MGYSFGVMPWKETNPMEEIIRFASLAASGRFTVTELSVEFGVSRKTAYKWLRRYRAEGSAGLRPRSRRPRGCAHGTVAAMVQAVLAARRAHPTWGPKKLRVVLCAQRGAAEWPARSTIARILKRHGLSRTRRRRSGVYHAQPSALTAATQPNEVWTVDFKGWFSTADGARCDSLTVRDLYSRYLLGCEARPNQQHQSTLRVFKALMRRHGLPKIIRVDNGTPFASCGLGRLSRLSVWWVKQGIAVEFTRPAHPQDNGAHERMHRDLKAECTRPASANLRAQQRRLERWQHSYNHERPHEALGLRKPAELYRRSERRLCENDKPLCYPAGYLRKRLSSSGQLRHEGKTYHVGEALAGERVGLRRNAAGQTELYFANLLLGRLVYDPQARFRPTASIEPVDQSPLTHRHLKTKPKV
jgi:putative transposase